MAHPRPIHRAEVITRRPALASTVAISHRSPRGYVRIGDTELRTLRQLVDYDGLTTTAKAIGISESPLLRVLAGYYDRCAPQVRQKIIKFFSEGAAGK